MDLINENDSRLKQVSLSVDMSSDSLYQRLALEKALLGRMASYGGIGLAAPQVGINLRAFAILIGDKTIVCFNPTIAQVSSEKQIINEGCLSFPDLWLRISRHSCIIATYMDACGNAITTSLEGLEAQCFQHELDHLDGICFTDVVSPLVLGLARKRRIKHRKIK